MRTSLQTVLWLFFLVCVSALPAEDAQPLTSQTVELQLIPEGYTPELIQLAAVDGNANAQCSLGYMYQRGEFVPKDNLSAIKWFRRAAGQHNANAMFALAQIYQKGVGVEPDNQQALEWFRNANAQRDWDEEMRKKQQEEIADNLYTKAQLCLKMNFKGTALKFYKEAVDNGSVQALNDIAWLYATSKDPAIRNKTLALEYAKKSAAAPSGKEPEALDTLAAAYACNENFDEAVKYEKQALELFKAKGSGETGPASQRLQLYQNKQPYVE
jgi:TPR repeat protein